ncbi:hypothetical protein BTIS_0251 [Bifidobacterium tissieri]|uniref:DUF3592 domain-containing protein n=1 Tax=Bifidobacterium tissieri TaxID=1630162 RepID=A0A261FJ63_9BIFI|nr:MULTISPECIES: DUF3592 domain-containing protein [Bifidobacterium]OZG59098.1 hypothetical protein BTIS_0251 [Bifidobacterium tissieri]
MQTTIVMTAPFILTGLPLIIVGLVIIAHQRNKIQRCVAVTTGWVVDYKYGNDCVCPILGYQANGRNYKITRKFRGIITTTKITPTNPYVDSGAYVSDKDVLHLKAGMVTNYRAVAERLWPKGTAMPVYYDPENPSRAFAQRIPNYTPILAIILLAIGAVELAAAFAIGIALTFL